MSALIVNTIADWISSLLKHIPKKLRPSLLELLFAAIIASGHVSDALLAITFFNHWTSYYKLIEYSHFSILSLAIGWFQLSYSLDLSTRPLWAIDDTICFRSSQNAPGADFHFDHSHKTNRPDYPLSQLFVSLFSIPQHEGKHSAIPIWMHLTEKDGNRSKLEIARNIVLIADKHRIDDRKPLLLTDSWYMKKPFISPLLKHQIHCVGQIRKDSTLFLPPEPATRKRGRPPKYGPKLSFQRVTELFKLESFSLPAWGQKRTFEFYFFQAKTRFLDGLLCNCVWCRFSTDDKSPTTWHLILSTDTSLGAIEIITYYAKRWSVEPAFNDIKNTFGLAKAWQQTKKAFARWRCLICIAYGICSYCSLFFGQRLADIVPIPWRKGHSMTPGWARKVLDRIFRYFPVRLCWDRTLQKMIIPEELLNRILKKIAQDLAHRPPFSFLYFQPSYRLDWFHLLFYRCLR